MSETVEKIDKQIESGSETAELLASGGKTFSVTSNWQAHELTINKLTDYRNYKRLVFVIVINNETIIQDVSYDVEVLKVLSLKQTDYTGETGYMTNELGGYVFEIAFTINSSPIK